MEARVWNIPEDRMKMDRLHRVPLTRKHSPAGAYEADQRLPPFVFPGRRDPLEHINDQSANAALKRLRHGGRLVAHGLRSLGSTTLNERGFNPDMP